MAKLTVVCFWCGKDTGEVRECEGTDRCSTVSYDPCPECTTNFAKGVAFFEVTKQPSHLNQPPLHLDINTKCYPSGRYAVVGEGHVKDRFPDRADELIEQGRALVTTEVFNALFGEDKETPQQAS